jgi:hypothetical protein
VGPSSAQRLPAAGPGVLAALIREHAADLGRYKSQCGQLEGQLKAAATTAAQEAAQAQVGWLAGGVGCPLRAARPRCMWAEH